MRSTSTTYSCDKCGKKLHTCSNVDIRTSLKEGSYWMRLHVVILYRHGMHSDGKQDQADLCQSCTIQLLEDAKQRVTVGERLSAGVERSEQSGWE